jgi:hypothetical protein
VEGENMKRNKKIYISGPIIGVPGAISAAHFAGAEQDLRELGFCNIINPRFMFEGTGLGAAYALGIPVHEYRRRLTVTIEEI